MKIDEAPYPVDMRPLSPYAAVLVTNHLANPPKQDCRLICIHDVIPVKYSCLYVQYIHAKPEGKRISRRRVCRLIRRCSGVYINNAVYITLAMAISRNQLALALSVTSLAITMVVWPELFLWSKVVHLPSWAEFLPTPIFAGAYVSLLCLLPAAFLTESFAGAKRALLIAVVITPAAAVATYVLNPIHLNKYLPFNAVFHYLWVILFCLLLPAAILGAIRKLASFRGQHG